MRALLSVFDKSGIVELARSLRDLGCELVSSGGTATIIAAAGIDVTDVADHFDAGSLDVILCNGVFGWGLDAREDVERAFAGCHRCLRPGGLFVLGWNDTPETRPFPLDECEALKRFEPYVFPPLGASHVPTETELRHTYDFFVKP